MGKVATMAELIRFTPKNRDQAVAVLTLATIAQVALTSKEILVALIALRCSSKEARNLLGEIQKVGTAYRSTGD